MVALFSYINFDSISIHTTRYLNKSGRRHFMILRDLFVGIEYACVQGTMQTEIFGMSVHSKSARKDDLFFCIEGTKSNGADYIEEVSAANVSAIVTEQAIQVPSCITVIKVFDIRKVMAKVASTFYGNPANKLTMIGITGTKGKTTTAFMLHKLLSEAEFSVGLIGTVGVVDLHRTYQTTNTTPDSIELYRILADMVLQGITIVVMEVSSQALMMHRVYGITFDYGIYTNLSSDHIGKGEHHSFDEYKACKKQLMQISKCTIINADDLYAKEMLEASHKGVTYGYEQPADYRATAVELVTKDGKCEIAFSICTNKFRSVDNVKFKIGMPGLFSMYNALAAITLCEELGIGGVSLYKCLQQIKVTGRMECIAVSEAFQCYIDYAHNQTALEQLILSMRAYASGRIILVFGCGGNRSRQRRFLMGEVANRLADVTIITNDNPRDENPDNIIKDIIQGFDNRAKYTVIKDRKEAIRYALTLAKQGDIVLLAGKGHETYQESGGVKYYMDERVLIKEIMEEENVRTICGYNYRYFD